MLCPNMVIPDKLGVLVLRQLELVLVPMLSEPMSEGRSK